MIPTTEPVEVFSLDHSLVLERYHAIADSMRVDINPYTHRIGAMADDPGIALFHRTEVLALIRQLTGRQDITPSYCFLSRYAKGTALISHTDRPGCHWTISQTILCDPPEAAADWYLQIGRARIGLEIGQAVLFRGTIIPHSRPTMPNHILDYVNCYYHFVPAS